MRMGMGVPKKKTRSDRKKEVKPVFSSSSSSSEYDSKKNMDRPPHWEVGKINCNLVGTLYGPILERMAEEGSERYANDVLEYTESLKDDSNNNNNNNNNETKKHHPPKASLFATTMNLEDFKNVLEETSQHFTSSSKSSKKKGRKKSDSSSSNDGTNGWKVHANAAKFERLLDEKYGPFRPLMDRMPQLEIFIRNTQRKIAKGHLFSPFRETRPLPIHTSMVLLFMLHRNKVKWQVTILAAIFFLTGLHPWALVTLVAGGRYFIHQRKRKNVANLPAKIQLTQPYYSTAATAATDDVDLERKKKYELLLEPVGRPLPKEEVLRDDYDVLIIGSGVSALYTAALLSRTGRQVLVLSSNNEDASDCRSFQKAPTKLLRDLPFDVQSNHVSYVNKMQHLLAPALCTTTDCQGGIRFATIGSESDAFAHDILSIPGMGTANHTTTTTTTDSKDTDPFIIHAGSHLHLANDAAISLADGWPQSENDTANSTTLAYLSLCQTLGADSMEFYTSKLFPDAINKNASTQNGYSEAGQRTASAFLDKCLPLNPHVRSLMAGLGMKNECLPPCRTSMAAAITNILSLTDTQGQAYPIGGPRALCHALTSVIQSNGGNVYCTGGTITTTELLFRSTDNHHPDSTNQQQQQQQHEQADTTTTAAPRCIGVKLSDGRSIFVSSEVENEDEEDGVVICTDGFLPTFIHRLPEKLRMTYGVPKGLPALTERRPLIHILIALNGTNEQLNLTGADWYRLPNASLALDEIDPHTKEITCGIIGAETLTNEDLQNTISASSTTSSTNDPNTDTSTNDIDAISMGDSNNNNNNNNSNKSSKKKDTRNYFTTGSSWMKVSFPSAKDPSWNDRFKDEKISTCVVTVEADNDTCREFSTKPRIFSILSNKDAKMRLMDRIQNDLLDNFPQLKGKLKHMELHGPFRAGLSHTPERFAAKGVRPLTPYPGLYIGGTDLTMGNSFSGEVVAGYLVTNAVIGYSFFDQMYLGKDIITDMIQHMETPKKRVKNNEDDLAVPFNQPSNKIAITAEDEKKVDHHATAESSKEE